MERDPYGTIRAWFTGGNVIDLLNDSSDKAYRKALDGVSGLRKLVESRVKEGKGDETYLYMELVLQGLAEFNVISKDILSSSLSFRDVLADMFRGEDFEDFE